MSGVLEGLEPRKVFTYFEQLTQIPRCSSHEKQVSDYLVEWARARGLEVVQDQALNLIIRKPASPGYETAPPVILQGHLDMVCEKNADTVHDFSKDTLKLRVDGDYIYASGTTLGADNGIAVAMAMAILDSPELDHPPLEVVLTTDEEAGMSGVQRLDPGLLKGRVLINLDSEEEGVFTAGCAGGGRVDFTIPVKKTTPHYKHFYRLTVKGLKGGHSGTDIDKERGNALRILGRVLNGLKDRCELAGLSGGSKANAIPRESQALLAVDDPAWLKETVSRWDSTLKRELAFTDPAVRILVEPDEAVETVYAPETHAKVVHLLNLVPNGPLHRDPEHDVVVASNNLGVLTSDDTAITLTCAPRSSVRSLLDHFLETAAVIGEILHLQVKPSSFYPGWEYTPQSTIRDLCLKTYADLYHKPGKVNVIHAGLECGFFVEKIPGLDAISFGPDMFDVHSPNEHLSIASTQRTYTLLCEILKRMNDRY